MRGKLVKGSKLKGQKFAVGDKVFVSKELPSYMKYFRSGESATILYSYDQACSDYPTDEDDAPEYMLEFKDGIESGWYGEEYLTKENSWIHVLNVK